MKAAVQYFPVVHILLCCFVFAIQGGCFESVMKHSALPPVTKTSAEYVLPHVGQSVFRNPGNFCLCNRNRYPGLSKSDFSSRNRETYFSDWYPENRFDSTDKESRIQYLEFGIHSLESTSQDSLELPYMGRFAPFHCTTMDWNKLLGILITARFFSHDCTYFLFFSHTNCLLRRQGLQALVRF